MDKYLNKATASLTETNHSENPSLKLSITKLELFCTRLMEDVVSRRVITSSNLSTFRKVTTYILNYQIKLKCGSLSELYNMLSDYTKNGFEYEENHSRGSSYIQLYQMTKMIMDYVDDIEMKFRAHAIVKLKRRSSRVIKAVYKKPRSSYTELQSTLSISDEELKANLAELSREKLIESRPRRTSKELCYYVTKLGKLVYEEQWSETYYNMWINNWDSERISALAILMLHCSKTGIDKPVQAIFNYVATLKQEKILTINESETAHNVIKYMECIISSPNSNNPIESVMIPITKAEDNIQIINEQLIQEDKYA